MLVEDHDAMIGFFLYKVTWNKEDPRYLMAVSENVGYIPNEIAIFHRDNDQQNHWV